MNKIPVLIFILLIISSVSQGTYIDHWELIIDANDEFRYWNSNSGDPGENWRSIGYNDQSWKTGKGGIGYGDGDDSTIVDPCISICIRKTFVVEDPLILADAWFYIDYDDAFVAYLNGSEISRSAGLVNQYPGVHELSGTQHEAGEREGFRIPDSVLAKYIITGENLLSVQVHNASNTSSDLSSSFWFIAATRSEAMTYRQVPEWFEKSFDVMSSKLPILIINTDNNASIVDEPKIDAYLGIIFNGDGRENHIYDPHNHYSGRIGIEIRGKSTSNFPKKPYDFETRDSLGANLNVSLFGWPEENDWVLRASYIDHTFIRNALANHMSRLNGWWASHTRMVELVLNGEYQGIYIFMEKIKRDIGRVDIADLYPDEIYEPDVTGGYIWEITGFEENLGLRRYLKYPVFEEAAPEQINYIRNYDDAFRYAMSSDDFADSTIGYHAYINVASFINEILVQEAMRNGDAYGWSGYFHKDRLGKINAGPVWDFDQSAGNSTYPDDCVVGGWIYEHPGKPDTPFFWKKLMTDPAFAYAVRQRWESMREGPYQTEKLFNYIDSIASLLSGSLEREFALWDVLGKYIWRETQGYENRDTYAKEVAHLKLFLTLRWVWMDENLAVHENPDKTLITTIAKNQEGNTKLDPGQESAPSVYPNPARELITLKIPEAESNFYNLSILNTLGIPVQQFPHVSPDEISRGYTIRLNSDLEPGVYLYRIDDSAGRIYHGRFMKIE